MASVTSLEDPLSASAPILPVTNQSAEDPLSPNKPTPLNTDLSSCTSVSSPVPTSPLASPRLSTLTNTKDQGDALVRQSLILLGLSKQFIGTERGASLQADAARLVEAAGHLREHLSKNTENAEAEAVELRNHAQSILDDISEKYASQATPVFAETQQLWDEVTQSKEAQSFAEAGAAVINDWKQYGDSEEGMFCVI